MVRAYSRPYQTKISDKNRAYHPLIIGANTMYGQIFKLVLHSYLGIPSTKPLLVWSYKILQVYERVNTKTLDSTGIPQAVPTQNLSHEPGVPSPNYRCKHNVRENISTSSILIHKQPLNKTTIIMVIYARTGLEENKYQNFG